MLFTGGESWDGQGWAAAAPSSGAGTTLPGFQLSRPLSMRIIDEMFVWSLQQSLLLATRSKHEPSPCPTVVEPDRTEAPECPAPTRTATKTLAVELDHCCLQLVLTMLAPRDLVCCQVVSRQWRDVASMPEVRQASLCSTWGLASVVAKSPREWAHLQSISSLQMFVRRHVVRPGESLQSIAVQRGGDLTSIKRLNSMISDHSLPSRLSLFVPGIKSMLELCGQAVRYEYDSISKRGHAVIFDPNEDETAEPDPQHEQGEQSGGVSKEQQSQMLAKMSALLAKSLQIDEGTARYYLEETGGDVKQAVVLAKQDATWEREEHFGDAQRNFQRHFLQSQAVRG